MNSPIFCKQCMKENEIWNQWKRTVELYYATQDPAIKHQLLENFFAMSYRECMKNLREIDGKDDAEWRKKYV